MRNEADMVTTLDQTGYDLDNDSLCTTLVQVRAGDEDSHRYHRSLIMLMCALRDAYKHTEACAGKSP
jgi:hypothetical protein